jgi:hypothetical protein
MVFEVADGPVFDHVPNFMRVVTVDREADVPGFIKCTDRRTGKTIIIHRSKLPVEVTAKIP